VNTVEVKGQCPECGGLWVLNVTEAQREKLRAGALIQDALPEMPPAERELLLSGICGKCWDKLFGGEEDEDSP